MYKIGEFSKLCRVSVNTLRYYDGEGLLKPDYIDKFTSYRYYTGENLKQFHTLTALKAAGFSLDEIKIIMQSDADITTVFEKKEKELKNDLSNLNDRLFRLAAVKNSLQKEGKNMFSVVVKEGNSIKAVTIRKLISNRTEILKTITEIKEYFKANNIQSGNVSVAINYEIEHVETNLDFEIGVSFTGKLPKECQYIEKTIDIKEKTAGVICNIDEVENAYASLSQYIGEQNYQIIGAFYELYHEDNTIEILVPVCKLTERRETPKNDDIGLPFENDDRVIGHWEVIDCLTCKEQFNKDKKKYTGQKIFREFYFLPNGEWYWCFGWTKGYLLSKYGYPKEEGKNAYTIQNIDGKNYMFIEMKLSDYYLYGGKSEIWVLRQTDNIAYKKENIKIKEDTNLPFISDNNVLGKWTVCDSVKSIESFDADIYNSSLPKHALFWKTVEFIADGNCRIAYDDNKSYEQPHYTWTKGYVLAHISNVVEKYELKRIKGCDYLFIEWKTGDYTFGGRKPGYYVFRREN